MIRRNIGRSAEGTKGRGAREGGFSPSGKGGLGVSPEKSFDFLFPLYAFWMRWSLNSSKLKDFADDNFKFYENGRKFSKRVENTLTLSFYVSENKCFENTGEKEKLLVTSDFSFSP